MQFTTPHTQMLSTLQNKYPQILNSNPENISKNTCFYSPDTIPQRLPLQVQIGHLIFTLKPQLSFYKMQLIMVLIKSIYQGIPSNEPIYIVNFTKGWRTGRLIEMDEQLSDLILDSEAKYPSIRLFWNNGIEYKVNVTVHDIMQLEYNMDMFDQLIDLIRNIKYEIIKKFHLSKQYQLGLELAGDLKGVKTMAYIGNYFKTDAINYVYLYISFKQPCSIGVAKQLFPEKYSQLVCPITHTLMQEPVITKCRHLFDKFSLCLQIFQKGRCPLCRSPIIQKQLKKSPKHTKMLNKIRDAEYQRRMQLKKQEQESPQPETQQKRSGNQEQPWKNQEEIVIDSKTKLEQIDY